MNIRVLAAICVVVFVAVLFIGEGECAAATPNTTIATTPAVTNSTAAKVTTVNPSQTTAKQAQQSITTDATPHSSGNNTASATQGNLLAFTTVTAVYSVWKNF